MESFDTKDCEVIESFDRKFEKFPSKDSELEEPTSEISESFESKDSGDNVPVDGVLQSFDRKFESSESKDLDNARRVSKKDSKLDGRSRIRSVKQIEAYKRNFGKGDSIELRLCELDVRMRHLQSLVIGVLRGRKN
jgi:hypothetical protein